jgi:hypothetical protein
MFSNVSVIIDPAKAWALLGWKPSHAGFLAALPTYYAAWKASGGK